MRRIDLYNHNYSAFEKAERMLESDGKAAIIHPTGTGKSYIAFALIERHPDKHFLWMAPSEYIYNLQMEKLWQKQHVRFANVEFYTYNRLMWHEEEIEKLNPDYIILDEFHRAGAHEWGKSVKKLIETYPKAKILGLSATNIRYLDNRRDMADELFEGCIASEMTLCDAMAKGILPEPKYVVTVYSYEERVRRLEKRIEVMQNGFGRKKSQEMIERLRRALEKANGMEEIFKKHLTDKRGKIILFCTDSEHMFEMAAKVPEWFYGIDRNPHIYRVYTYNPESELDFQKFKDDESDHLKLLFCIDMLNEGIHVDGVSAVVLCRPTVSPIIYKQQIGRAIAAGGVEKPIIFDLVNNFESLNPIDEFQAEYKKAKGNAREESSYYDDIDGFEIIDELKGCRSLMEQIQRNIETTWDICYKEYVRYVEEHDSSRIPRRYVTEGGLQLGKWIQRQRTKYQEGKLPEEYIELLEKCGISWESASDENFNNWLQLLKDYKEEHGNLLIYGNYVTENGDQLGQWCHNIRLWYRQGKVSEDRQHKLEGMGFAWDGLDYYWEQGYRHAKEYYEKHGSLDMTTKYICEDGYKLGSWISRQRKVRYGKLAGIMTDEKIRMLDEIGMIWKLPELLRKKKTYPIKQHNTHWERHYSEAKAFYESNGHLFVPVLYTQSHGGSLAQWVNLQRREWKKENHGTLTQKQVDLLEEIHIERSNCMVYKFEVGLEKFKTYVAKYHDNLIPMNYVTEDGFALGKWSCHQRTKYHSGEMQEWQKQALNEAGIEWRNVNTVKAEQYWDEMYEAAKEYANRYGDISNVPHNYVTEDGRKLGQWISQQRGIRRGVRKHSIDMNEKRIAKLDAIGMIWKPTWNSYKRIDDSN